MYNVQVLKLLPNTFSDNILNHGLCVSGSVEEGIEFANDKERHEVEPDLEIF